MKTPTQRRSRHGLNALKARISVRGLAGVDMRTSSARSLFRWKQELLRDLGGDLPAQKIALVELAVRTRLFIEHLDAFLMSQPSLLNRRRKSVIPALRERMSLVDSLGRILDRLGLERVAKPVPSLQDYLRSRENESDEPGVEVKPEPDESEPSS
jgi:hypothetical protein